MTMPQKSLQIGFIPLVDAAPLLVAVDKGYLRDEGLDVTLVREVSWSNVRDKLNIGRFDAAHLLAPVAIASSLGLGQVREPIVAPFTLAMNGNAITLSPALHQSIVAELGGETATPLATAFALKRVIARRAKAGAAPLTFGMTFPFSLHNYELRFWMAAAGIDPDDDVRLVVLPPPYMVDSLERGQVDGFCVGAPWNSLAVARGFGHILHFGVDIFPRATEKVLALRQRFVDDHPETVDALIRALSRAVAFLGDDAQRAEAVALLAGADRLGVEPAIIQATLEGRLPLKAPGGAIREHPDYLLLGRHGTARPNPVHASWLYVQMVRWGQARFDPESYAAAARVFRPDLHDRALGADTGATGAATGGAASFGEGVSAFAGPSFDPDQPQAELDYWRDQASASR